LPSARSRTAPHLPSGSAAARGGRGATRSADGTPPDPTGVSQECSDELTSDSVAGSNSTTLSLDSRTAIIRASRWLRGAPKRRLRTAIEPTAPCRSNSATTSRDTASSSVGSEAAACAPAPASPPGPADARVSPPPPPAFARATAAAPRAASLRPAAEDSRRMANTVRWFACVTTRLGGAPSPIGCVKYAAHA
jgi:hypothetical protein